MGTARHSEPEVQQATFTPWNRVNFALNSKFAHIDQVFATP